MPPALRDPDDPAEWLRRARSNLVRARADRDLPGVLYEDLCFDAQQAVEKAAKALLLKQGAAVPRIHGIGELLDLVEKTGLDVPDAIKEASQLTDYAVTARYPGIGEDVSVEEYQKALALAEHVFEWAEAIVAPGAQS